MPSLTPIGKQVLRISASPPIPVKEGYELTISGLLPTNPPSLQNRAYSDAILNTYFLILILKFE
ncbi:MAG: hypothetical protein ACFFDH_20970 [Promethearchaeota archaeon]